MVGVYLRIFNRMLNRTTLLRLTFFSLAILVWSLVGMICPRLHGAIKEAYA